MWSDERTQYVNLYDTLALLSRHRNLANYGPLSRYRVLVTLTYINRGTQQIRLKIGHSLFGSRVVYGDGIFMTVTPSERHSGLVLRLSRYRREDPIVQEDLRGTAGHDTPKLEADDVAYAELPAYKIRCKAAARDPYAVVSAFLVWIKYVLPKLLGLRMCPNCPHCNADDSGHKCQDMFGSNMTPLGGIFGAIEALGGAVENQRGGTPHFHFNCHLASSYQHMTLLEIAKLIEQELLRPEDVFEFHSWLCREEHMDNEAHQKNVEAHEAAWETGYAAREHDGLCQLPQYLGEKAPENLWHHDISEEDARAEGKRWKQAYFKDVQFVFSRRHHHWHKRDKKTGERVPLIACRKKGRAKGKCRQRFPKTKQLCARVKVVCPGVASKHDLRISGRRNALGSLLGRRSCEWFTGTSPAFAAIFRSNTNVTPNFRLPITKKTHDVDCKRDCVALMGSLRKICKVAQRAQRQMTGYFCGYQQKRQPVGQYELREAAHGLQYLRRKLLKDSPVQQWGRIANKVLADLEQRGTMRTAPEDFMLTTQYHEHDATHAEFIRTFRSVDFHGHLFLQQLDLERKKQATKQTVCSLLPPRRRVTSKDHVPVTPWVHLYGFRSKDPDVHFLNPWEFVMYWDGVALKPPWHYEATRSAMLTKWTEKGEKFYKAHKETHPENKKQSV